MVKVKKAFITVITFILTALFCMPLIACGNQADGGEKKSAVDNEEVAPLGLYTDLQFALNGENGYVQASVKNKFTLFPSIVTVHAELYRSDIYEDDIKNMTLASSSYIYDLDQGETIVASASTEGRQSFWKARAYYKVDNNDWQECFSETVFFGSNGVRTEPIPEEKDYYISDFLQKDAGSVEIKFYPERIPHYDPDPRYNNLSLTTPDDFFFLENGYEINTVKKAFGEVKLDPFDFENQQFYFSFRNGTYFYIKLSDGSKAIIGMDGRKEDTSEVNLYVRYSKEGEYDKGFTATISQETVQAVLDAVNKIYKIQHNINAFATEWINFVDLLQDDVQTARVNVRLAEKILTYNLDDTDLISIKNVLNVAEVAPYDMNKELPAISAEYYFNTSIEYAYYSLTVKFADNSVINIYLSHFYTSNISVNLFIVLNNGGTHQYFTGYISNDTQKALVELTKETYDKKMLDNVAKLLESMK